MMIAVVTGASSGLGREFALQIDKKMSFDEIWLVARREDRLNSLAAAMKTPVRVLALDLTRGESFKTLSGLLETERPDVRLLVNAAGFGKFGSVMSQRPEDISGMISLNIGALVSMTVLFAKYMCVGSRIVNFASVSGFVSLPYMNVYSATKAFVLSYSRALNDELRPRGISVTAVCPYWVDTEFIQVASDSPEGGAVNSFPLICSAVPVVAKAIDDSSAGRGTSLYGAAANGIRILSRLLPVCLQSAVWSCIRHRRRDDADCCCECGEVLRAEQ